MPTIEQSVKKNPALVLAKLAEVLGLNYSVISHQNESKTQLVKRRDREENVAADDLRPSKKSAKIMPNVFEEGDLLQFMTTERYATESPQPQSHVGWSNEPLPRTQKLKTPARD